MREYTHLLNDILKASEDIESFTRGMSFKEFIADEKTRSAVLYKFAVMGEARKNSTRIYSNTISRYSMAKHRRIA